jgi:hypothetical protein
MRSRTPVSGTVGASGGEGAPGPLRRPSPKPIDARRIEFEAANEIYRLFGEELK